MPRETFLRPGVPEGDAERQRRETEILSQKRLNIKGALEAINEFFGGDLTIHDLEEAETEMHNLIDFETLRNVFAEVYRRCGLDEASMNFLGPDRIIVNVGAFDGDYYDVLDNTVDLFPIALQVRMGSNESRRAEFIASTKRNFGSIELLQIHTIIHELVHAMSRAVAISSEQDKSVNAYVQSGYHRLATSETQQWSEDSGAWFNGRPITSPKNKDDKLDIIFDRLNEGVVEQLARSIMLIYLKQVGWDAQETQTYEDRIVTNKYIECSYSTEVFEINRIITHIAQSAGVPRQTVADALIRGLIEGETFDSPEVKQLFKEAFHDDDQFLVELSRLMPNNRLGGTSNNKKTVSDLIDESRRRKDTGARRKKVRRKHLEQE